MDAIYQAFSSQLPQLSENYLGMSLREAREFFHRDLGAIYARKPAEFWETDGNSQYDSIVCFLMGTPRNDFTIECLAAFVRANLETGHIDLNRNVRDYIGDGEYVQRSRLAILGRTFDTRIFSAVIDSIAKMPSIKLETVMDAQICGRRIDCCGLMLAEMVAEAQGYDNEEIDCLTTRFLEAAHGDRAKILAEGIATLQVKVTVNELHFRCVYSGLTR